MVTEGTYRHYKGRDYRVLFVTEWWGPPTDLPADARIHVAANDHGVGLMKAQVNTSFMSARWSGNTGVVKYRDAVVIYVALYGDGRVAARPLDEFEQRTGGDLDVARFEKISE